MKVIHSARTAVTQAASSGKLGEVADMVGVVYLREKDNELKLYVPVPEVKLDLILDAEPGDLHFLADCEEAVLSELQRRYPCSRPEATFIYRASNIYWEYYSKKKEKWVDKQYSVAWAILDRPLAMTDTVDELASLSMALGPVLITESKYGELFPRGYLDAEAAHFTVKDRSFDGKMHNCRLVQVNYNPHAMRRREYAQKSAWVKKLRGGFEKEHLHALYQRLRPDEWPNGHPWKGVVFGRDLYNNRRSHGWGHSAPKTIFDVTALWDLIRFNRKIGHGTWWRNEYAFKETLQNILPYVAGVEYAAREKEAKHNAQVLEYYRHHLQTVQDETDAWMDQRANGRFANDYHAEIEDGDLDSMVVREEPRQAVPLIDFKKSHYDEYVYWRTDLNFCRWLRREAKAAELAVPKLPTMPKAPKKKRSKRVTRKNQKNNGILSGA